jgi:hypothetical protein
MLELCIDSDGPDPPAVGAAAAAPRLLAQRLGLSFDLEGVVGAFASEAWAGLERLVLTKGMPAAGYRALGAAADRLPALRALAFCRCDLDDYYGDALAELLEAFGDRLVHLSIERCKIDCRSLVGPAMAARPRLETCSLSGCDLGSDGVQRLARTPPGRCRACARSTSPASARSIARFSRRARPRPSLR